MLVEPSGPLKLGCKQPEKETQLDPAPVRDVTEEAFEKSLSSREKAEDHPIGQPHFIVIALLRVYCLYRLKARVNDSAAHKQNSPALKEHRDYAKHKKNRSHNQSRIYMHLLGQFFYLRDLVPHHIENCGLFCQNFDYLVHL